jgi:hypothetical protein
LHQLTSERSIQGHSDEDAKIIPVPQNDQEKQWQNLNPPEEAFFRYYKANDAPSIIQYFFAHD